MTYDDVSPWPVGLSIVGDSLTRVDMQERGDEASNWIAVPPSPGRVGVVSLQVLQVAMNAGLEDPPDLPSGPQPSSWLMQGSALRRLSIQFNAPVLADASDLRLTNLGVNAPLDADVEVILDSRPCFGQWEW